MDWLSDVFQKGGPFFIINTFFLAVVIGIIVERAIYFLGRGHLNAKAFLEQIKRRSSATPRRRQWHAWRRPVSTGCIAVRRRWRRRWKRR
jgi:hypothetical protein